MAKQGCTTEEIIHKLREADVLTFAWLCCCAAVETLMSSMAFGWFDWFRNTHQPVKPRRYTAENRALMLPRSCKYAYTLAYTPSSTVKKPAEKG